MARMYYDEDADLALIRGRKVAILGYGSQGHAHALNLRDSGIDVRVGLPPSSESRAKAETQGLTVLEPSEACAWAAVIMVLVPDTVQAALYREAIRPHLTPARPSCSPTDSTCDSARWICRQMWTSRWSRRSHQATASANCIRRAPVRRRSSPSIRMPGAMPSRRPGIRKGHRRHSCRGHRDNFHGGNRNRSVRRAGGALRRGDRTGQGRIRNVGEAGYQPEIAYFECLHELKLIVDLMYQGGLATCAIP